MYKGGLSYLLLYSCGGNPELVFCTSTSSTHERLKRSFTVAHGDDSKLFLTYRSIRMTGRYHIKGNHKVQNVTEKHVCFFNRTYCTDRKAEKMSSGNKQVVIINNRNMAGAHLLLFQLRLFELYDFSDYCHDCIHTHILQLGE